MVLAERGLPVPLRYDSKQAAESMERSTWAREDEAIAIAETLEERPMPALTGVPGNHVVSTDAPAGSGETIAGLADWRKRERIMHRAVIAFVLSVGLIVAGAAPAAAVSTRAEYVAQVDPICRGNLGQWKRTYAAGAKEYKKWVRLTNKGTLKAWERQTHRYARSLKQHVRVHRSLTDRVSVVPPPAEDAQLVADWLRYRRTYERLANSSAKAFDAFKFGRSDKLIGRANKAGETEWRIAASLGLLESCK